MQSQSNTIATTLSYLSPIPINLQYQPNAICSIFSTPFLSTVEMMDYSIITENRRANNTTRRNVTAMDWKLESAATNDDEDAMEIDEDEDDIAVDEDAMEIDEEEDEEIDPDL